MGALSRAYDVVEGIVLILQNRESGGGWVALPKGCEDLNDPVHPHEGASDRPKYRADVSNTGTLISRSCTTGWSDWIHGELWLTNGALVRSRLSLSQTHSNGAILATVRSPVKAVAMPMHLASEQIRAGHRTNRYISMTDIAAAALHRGLLSDRLTLTLQSGAQFKLLWLSVDPAFKVLREALPEMLQDRFTID